MDFETSLKRLLEGLGRLNTRYALVGGFALGALGAARATADLDFLVHRDDLETLHRFLQSLGYRRIHHTENVSQYDGTGPEWGAVDLIHAFRPMAVEMLQRAVPKPVFQGTATVRVVSPEDLIGLKVQAMAGNPKRKLKEMADIEALASASPALDWERVEKFYTIFGLDSEFRMLRDSLKND